MKKIVTLIMVIGIMAIFASVKIEKVKSKKDDQKNNKSNIGKSDPRVFKDFTGSKVNPRAKDNGNPSWPPDHGDPPPPPFAVITNFNPFDMGSMDTRELNIMQQLSKRTNPSFIYSRSTTSDYTVYYNNTAFNFLDVPAETEKYFKATFNVSCPRFPIQKHFVYARLFYHAQNGLPFYQDVDAENFYGGSEILRFNVNTPQLDESSILYKIKHNPKNKYNDALGLPYTLLDLPRAGDYDFMLVVADDSSYLHSKYVEPDFLKEINPFDYYTNEYSDRYGFHVVYKIYYNGLHLTTLDEGFDNPDVVTNSTSNGNLFTMAWYQNADRPHNHTYYPVPNVRYDAAHHSAEDYTPSDYDYYNSIPPDDDSRRFKTIDKTHPFDPTYSYCYLDFFYKSIDVSGSSLHLINEGQPNTPIPFFLWDDDNSSLTLPKTVLLSNYSRNAGHIISLYPFLYGRISSRAKFPQLINGQGMPNGLFPALWLQDFITGNSFNVHCSGDYHYADGNQLQELDIEIYTLDADSIRIGFSIHDYNCGGNRPAVDNTCNNPQWTNTINGKVFNLSRCSDSRSDGSKFSAVQIFWTQPKSFLESFHVYTIDWQPGFMKVYVSDTENPTDNDLQAYFTSVDAFIPNHPMRILFDNQWGNQSINSIPYYYKNIPFPVTDKSIDVDWIKVQ